MSQENIFDITGFFSHAKQDIVKQGYQWEIDVCNKRYFSTRKPIDFLNEYAFVVLNTGMKNQVAEKMFKRLFTDGIETVHHKQKRESIDWMQSNYEKEFQKLQEKLTDEDKIEFLETLPFIGKITKYHLARNLGIDCAKPDRHLERLAYRFGFSSTHDMCDYVAKKTGERIGTVDVILWRYSNLHNTRTQKGIVDG